MGRKWKAAAAALAIAIAGASAFGLRHLHASDPGAAAGDGREAPRQAAPRPRSAPAGERLAHEKEQAEEAPAPPRSLRGTDVDGALRVDEHGDLVLGPEVIAFFDYFLSATGEESPEALRARILAAIRERLDGPAALQAAALLDKYLAYREAGLAMRERLPDNADPASRLEAVRKLRRDHFGEEAAEQLFGDEEREAAIAAGLEAELPEAAAEARAEAIRPLQQQGEDEDLRAAGATDAELHAHRAATVGGEAADRLAALDQRRAEWQRRVEAFREERARIAATARDERSRIAAEQALLARSFSPAEQLRVKAILKISGE